MIALPRILLGLLACVLLLGPLQCHAATFVEEWGGDGGYGADGSDKSLVNVATGSGGDLLLQQYVHGGAGGWGDDFDAPGKGGFGSSILTSLAGLGTNSTSYDAQGFGGQGGYAAVGSKVDGGPGGNAHAGFDLIGPGEIEGSARATGGEGGEARGSGNGGAGGNGSLDPAYGKSTTNGPVTVRGVVIGGDGGDTQGGGQGGNGASPILNDGVDGDTSGELILRQSVAGGDGGTAYHGGDGGSGGSAEGRLSPITKNASYLDISTYTTGGRGGLGGYDSGLGNGGDGGGAIAETEAVNDPGATDASATAIAGRGGSGNHGGDGGQGGAASAKSQATSITSYIICTASANRYHTDIVRDGDGGDVYEGVGNQAGDGGDAEASAVGSSAAPSPLSYGNLVSSSAHGGYGGSVRSGSGDGGAGGAASAQSSYSTSQDQTGDTVHAFAQGGDGGDGRGSGYSGGAGGTASATAFATSPGRLYVEAWQVGGHGGDGRDGAKGAPGADSHMTDQVGGDAAHLELFQEARGGHGGLSDFAPGQGGDASSVLTGTSRGTSSTLYEVVARGGGGGSSASAADGSPGGDARVRASLTGPGEISVHATAYGATGGHAYGTGNCGAGGTAILDTVYGESTTGGPVHVSGEARGGDGGSYAGDGSVSGANGTSISLTNEVDGETTGDLYLSQSAYGGRGGNNCFGSGEGGPGGDAESSLSATKSAQYLSLTASAVGGAGGNWNCISPLSTGGDGGKATAWAEGVNTTANASLDVEALAAGGAGSISADGSYGKSGAALATAIGTAASGSVSATATSNLASSHYVSAQASAPLASTSTAEARANVDQPLRNLADASGKQAAAFGTALPGMSSLDPLLALNPTVQASFTGTSTVLGYGVLGATATSSDPRIFSASLEYCLDIQGVTIPQNLIVGLLDASFTGSDFINLEFSIHDQGHEMPLYNVTFSDAALALDFFDDRLLNLGLFSAITGGDTDLHLLFQYSLLASNGTGFDFNFIYGNAPVPIAGSLLLLGTGLLGLGAAGWRRRRKM